MARTYYVYLSEDEADNPEAAGTGGSYEGHDWIAFICPIADVRFRCNNELYELQDHKSFEQKFGMYKFTVDFQGVKILSMGTYVTGKVNYNDLSAFCVAHAAIGGSTLYGMIYMDIGDGNAAWMDFPNASGSMVDYMQCRVKGFHFKFDATKGYAVGEIQLEEEWG